MLSQMQAWMAQLTVVVLLVSSCGSDADAARCAPFEERFRALRLPPIELMPHYCEHDSAGGDTTAPRTAFEAAFRAAGYQIAQSSSRTYGDASEGFYAVAPDGAEVWGVSTGVPVPRGRSYHIGLTRGAAGQAEMIPAEVVASFTEERMLAGRLAQYEREALAQRLLRNADGASSRCRSLSAEAAEEASSTLLEVPAHLHRPVVLDPPLSQRNLGEIAAVHAEPLPELPGTFSAFMWAREGQSNVGSGDTRMITTYVGDITVGVIDAASETLLCARSASPSAVIPAASEVTFDEDAIRRAAARVRDGLLPRR